MLTRRGFCSLDCRRIFMPNRTLAKPRTVDAVPIFDILRRACRLHTISRDPDNPVSRAASTTPRKLHRPRMSRCTGAAIDLVLNRHTELYGTDNSSTPVRHEGPRRDPAPARERRR